LTEEEAYKEALKEITIEIGNERFMDTMAFGSHVITEEEIQIRFRERYQQKLNDKHRSTERTNES
jgi:hypothetical protein